MTIIHTLNYEIKKVWWLPNKGHKSLILKKSLYFGSKTWMTANYQIFFCRKYVIFSVFSPTSNFCSRISILSLLNLEWQKSIELKKIPPIGTLLNYNYNFYPFYFSKTLPAWFKISFCFTRSFSAIIGDK